MRRGHRWLSLTLLIAAAAAWSLALGVLGLWLIASDHSGMMGTRWISASGGVAALAGSQFVFLVCVAGRVFPSAHALLTRSIEGALGVIFLSASGVLTAASLARLGGG